MKMKVGDMLVGQCGGEESGSYSGNLGPSKNEKLEENSSVTSLEYMDNSLSANV